MPTRATTDHAAIQRAVVSACAGAGFDAKEEFRGSGWRADILATRGSFRVAFEIQLSAQTLARTLERQVRYREDGIECCWLFERPIPKLKDERPDLPVFYAAKEGEGDYRVCLSDRKEMPLAMFVRAWLHREIRFCEIARAADSQRTRINFFESQCWKCHAWNHIYWADVEMRAMCNAIARPFENAWDSSKFEYRPEVIRAVRRFLETDEGRRLRVGDIKMRHSKTVGNAYVSFGCYKCDSIFGDFYVCEEQQFAALDNDCVAFFMEDIRLSLPSALPFPHWCHVETGSYCDGTPALATTPSTNSVLSSDQPQS